MFFFIENWNLVSAIFGVLHLMCRSTKKGINQAFNHIEAMASAVPGLGPGAPCTNLQLIFHLKCPLQNENGLALLKMKFQTSW